MNSHAVCWGAAADGGGTKRGRQGPWAGRGDGRRLPFTAAQRFQLKERDWAAGVDHCRRTRAETAISGCPAEPLASTHAPASWGQQRHRPTWPPGPGRQARPPGSPAARPRGLPQTPGWASPCTADLTLQGCPVHDPST